MTALPAPRPGVEQGADLLAAAGVETRVALGPEAVLLRARALQQAPFLLEAIENIAAQAPLRRMPTRGGRRMSVQTTSCGAWGWQSSAAGYAYEACDPQSGKPWPPIPAALQSLATQCAAEAGFAGFVPDSCLINRYVADSRMGLHQDLDEASLNHPIVSISLGMNAVFLWGGLQRRDKTHQLELAHGDVLVWGGGDRMRFHGVRGLSGAPHPVCGDCRYNLTLRRARP